jgi:thiamine biosynthesis lipoprotein
MLSLGGNIRTIGAKGPQAQPWLVGIRDPRDFDPVDKAPGGEQQPPARELAFVLAVQDKAVVTSGVYQRGYVADGGYYHHIIDPETLFPSTRYDSVTIVCGDSGLADSLTTALFNLSREEGAALLADIPDAEAVWIQGENHWFTDGFSQYIKK